MLLILLFYRQFHFIFLSIGVLENENSNSFYFLKRNNLADKLPEGNEYWFPVHDLFAFPWQWWYLSCPFLQGKP